MILRSIRVEGWRCFAAPVEVGRFIDGLNIIHGPNGAGKSTLMMALARGLFDSHNVGGDAIKSLRSWGRSLNPKVTIEFEQNGERFQLHKQFLTSATSQLSRMENDRFVPLAEGRAADEQVRETLRGDAPLRGACDQRHWGLAQILWATQGNLQITALADGTKATIQDALGAQITSPSAETVEKQIANAYDQLFTPGGRPRGGASAPAVVGLTDSLEKAKQRQTELQQKLDEFDQASRRIEDLRSQTQIARQSETELNNRLRETRTQADAYKNLTNQKQLHEKDVAAATESYRVLRERIESIRTAKKDQAEATQSLKSLLDDLPAQSKLVEQCQAESTRADETVKKVRARRTVVTEARALARLAERYVTSQTSLDDLESQLEKVDAAESELSQLRKSRDRILAPDKKLLDKITKIARQRDDARLQLDAVLITVTIRPETELHVDITTAEAKGQSTLAAEQPREIKGAPEVAFRIPGVGSFHATGPTGSVDDLRDQFEKAQTTFDELTAGFGTDSVSELARLHAQADEVDQQISKTTVRVEALLDGNSNEELRNRRTHVKGVVDEILSKQTSWKNVAPDPEALTLTADDIEQQFKIDIDAAEAAKDQSHEALQMALKKQMQQDANINAVVAQIAATDKRLESLTNDDMDDAARSAALNDIAIKRDAAQGKLAQVEPKIAEFGDDPSKSIAFLEGQLEALRNDCAEADRKLNNESGRLDQLTSEAPYSALAKIDEEVSRLEEEIAREQLHMDATRLLHETLVEQKRTIMQSILDPIRLRANHILQRIVGPRFENVHFNESLLPTGIAPRSIDDSVSLDQISGGEQEQVYFAVRMALADVAFGNQRQLVVLDDVFTYTDTTRLARITTILDEAAERFQIVLLTCHPERYRGLPNARFFDLERIVAERQK